MSSSPVAFIDSGIGGIPYLLATRAAMPGSRLVYFADNRNFPYGERTVEHVRALVLEAAAMLMDLENPRAIVVACNTASVVALEALRERFEIPFIGVVPAIKPAAELARRGRIGVLATQRTVADPYVSQLIQRYAVHSDVVLVAAGGLVELIERSFGAIPPHDLEAALAEPVQQLRAAGVAAVVLGCTHFIHVRDQIEMMLGDAIAVVDSVDGVVRQTVRVAGQDSATPATGPTPIYLSSSAGPAPSYRHLSQIHEFELRDAHARNSAHR
ncbi:MAG: glutamate racemase [Spirochaetota bacterium]